MSQDKQFSKTAADTLKKLESALVDLDNRLEADLGGDVLTLEFDDGRTYVVNSHSAARQIWVAAEARAWHLSLDADGSRWVDTREGRELWSLVSELVGRKLGRSVTLGG